MIKFILAVWREKNMYVEEKNDIQLGFEPQTFWIPVRHLPNYEPSAIIGVGFCVPYILAPTDCVAIIRVWGQFEGGVWCYSYMYSKWYHFHFQCKGYSMIS